MRERPGLLLLVLASALALHGCAGTSGPDADDEARSAFALPGTSWLVHAYGSAQSDAVIRVIENTSLHVAFGKDGNLSGSAGCNRYFSGYEVDGEKIAIGPAGSTMMMCARPGGIMEQEAAFLGALSTSRSFRIERGRLQLRTMDGALAVELVSAVTGTLRYHARRALTPGSKVEVRVEDVSLADAPAILIGQQLFETEGNQVPFPFEVPFDPADIDARHTYALSARITDPGGRLLFINTTAHHVITHESSYFGVDLVLDLVP